MNSATKHDCLPPMIADMLHDPVTKVDNLFADTWKQLRFNSLIYRAGFRKRSGTDVVDVVFLLLLWKWINVSSISMFATKSMGLFTHASKDVLYDTLKREDINWREFNLQVAQRVYADHGLDKSRVRAFVLDDSIKERRGKKLEAVSSHFDHVSNTYVMGQQVLTLGLATDEAFLPVDSQIFISDSKAHKQIRPYKDGRSVGAKRYDEAIGMSKVQMAVSMLRRAARAGLRADYLCADAWFGNKEMMRAALSLQMTAILRMKKNKLKYRVNINAKTHLLDAKELYQSAVRKQWKKVRGMPWKAVEMTVEVDLAKEKGKDKEPEYAKVKLLFVRGVNEDIDVDGSRKDWALFLSTDETIGVSTMLEAYALRWSIEVYFKEAKQHLGFLKEQTVTFVSHTASIHLCAIRYLMLMNGKLSQTETTVGQLRATIQDQLNTLSFATRLWQIFRAIVGGTLKSLSRELGCSVRTIMKAIDARVEEFFVSSLQLDVLTMELEHQ
jgi:hypothetical protein